MCSLLFYKHASLAPSTEPSDAIWLLTNQSINLSLYHHTHLNSDQGHMNVIWLFSLYFPINQSPICREKINIYFSGATFQTCLHENNILKFVLHWTLCKFMGLFLIFGGSFGHFGAISPRAPVYFAPYLLTHWFALCCIPDGCLLLHEEYLLIFSYDLLVILE